MWQRLSRSELLSTFFPTWIWQGRQWAKWRIPKYDPYYWIVADVHPVLSTYYPPQFLGAFAFSRFKIDTAFKGFLSICLLHGLFSFYGWFMVVNYWSSPLVALFGAITFTLAGYNWKQQPCYQYTVAWFPWLLYGIATNNFWLAGISSGMIYLAGYYPIGIQCLFVAFLATFAWSVPTQTLLWIPIGLLIGAVQLYPFIRYLPKTIRANKVSSIGKVPWWHFFSLIFPKAFRFNVSGVGYWEMSYYVGVIPIFTIWYTQSRAVFLMAVACVLMLGLGSSYLPRIPARWSYIFQFGLIWSAISGLVHLGPPDTVLWVLILLQTYDLLANNGPLLVNHPYAELYNLPSRSFNTRLTCFLASRRGDHRVSGLPYPLFTGHINEIKTLGYSGGMQLKLMAKWRKDSNSDGSGQHDFFKGDGDPNDLTRYRVKFAITSARTDWRDTQIKHLYANPELC